MKERMLMKRRFLIEKDIPYGTSKRMSYFYAAKLLNQFGVLVDKPELVTADHVALISEFYGINVPKSFYANPQDTRYFTCTELLVEQVVGYWFSYGHKPEGQSQRIEIFDKMLPDYQEGKEVKFRDYSIINEAQAFEVLVEASENLGAYTRKWSESEAAEFEWLYVNGYMSKLVVVKGKDNAVEMFNKYPVALFAQSFDRKDVVKLSVEMIGETTNVSYTPEQKLKLYVAARNCMNTPVSNKQAKFFNTIAKKVNVRTKKVTNAGNADKIATQYMKQGRVLDAAMVYAKAGSMLSRRIVWLLSRANPREAVLILDMIKVTNPLVTMQFLQSLLDQSNGPRMFSFYNNRQVVKHMETEYEARWRKSILSTGTKKLIQKEMLTKVDNFYKDLPKLGKVYIDDAFKKIAVPFNTSADGEGIDGAPTGTRQPITDDFIRAFVYWKNVRDIDSSVVFVHKNGSTGKLNWGNYRNKPFGNSALTSGDDTSNNGMEYIDFKLSELEARGYEFGIYQLNGFGGDFSKADAYCGYQNKSDLNTTAWQANNMALKIKLPQAKSREYVGFIVDIKNREVIVINQMQAGNDRIVSTKIVDYLKKYMNSDYVKQFNIFKIASLRATEIVSNPLEADVVFSDNYKYTGVNDNPTWDDIVFPPEGQKVIRTTETEKLVGLML